MTREVLIKKVEDLPEPYINKVSKYIKKLLHKKNKTNKKFDPFYSEENQAILRRSIKEAEMGMLTEHDLIRL